MRIRTLALLTGLVFRVFSHAQSAGLGIKGGALASTINALNMRTTPIPGATAGIYVPWGVGPRMEIQPEVMVSTLGAILHEPDGDDINLRSLYVQVPVSVKMYLNNGLNLSGGYQFGKILMAQRTGTEGSAMVTDDFKAMDMGFVGGVGMDLESGLDLTLRAYGAMTPSLREDDALFLKNRSLQFTVGYRVAQFKGRRHSARRR